jgi:hypothetical protein
MHVRRGRTDPLGRADEEIIPLGNHPVRVHGPHARVVAAPEDGGSGSIPFAIAIESQRNQGRGYGLVRIHVRGDEVDRETLLRTTGHRLVPEIGSFGVRARVGLGVQQSRDVGSQRLRAAPQRLALGLTRAPAPDTEREETTQHYPTHRLTEHAKDRVPFRPAKINLRFCAHASGVRLRIDQRRGFAGPASHARPRPATRPVARSVYFTTVPQSENRSVVSMRKLESHMLRSA